MLTSRVRLVFFAVNKWDIVSKDTKTMKNFTMRVREEFAFMSYAEIIFISAKTGQRDDKLFGTYQESK